MLQRARCLKRSQHLGYVAGQFGGINGIASLARRLVSDDLKFTISRPCWALEFCAVIHFDEINSLGVAVDGNGEC